MKYFLPEENLKRIKECNASSAARSAAPIMCLLDGGGLSILPTEDASMGVVVVLLSVAIYQGERGSGRMCGPVVCGLKECQLLLKNEYGRLRGYYIFQIN